MNGAAWTITMRSANIVSGMTTGGRVVSRDIHHATLVTPGGHFDPPPGTTVFGGPHASSSVTRRHPTSSGVIRRHLTPSEDAGVIPTLVSARRPALPPWFGPRRRDPDCDVSFGAGGRRPPSAVTPVTPWPV